MSIPPPNPGFGVSADDVRAYDWQAVVAGVQRRECYSYSEALSQHAKSLKEARDDKGACVFRLLAAVASFCPNYDSHQEPFGPMMVCDGKRTATPEDLTPADLDALAGILAEIRDPEFRARVGDVLWV